MNRQNRSAPPIGSWTSLTSLQWEGLKLLRKAADTAGRLGQNRWQFAVEMGQLHAAGLSNTDLRHLLCLGYIEHGQERTRDGARQRIFHPLSTLVLPERTCFVVTAKGCEAASEEGADNGTPVSLHGRKACEFHGSLPKVPCWNGESRQLRWQGLLIKEFHQPARNQATVLAAFEEEGWPMRIDDPLTQTPEVDPKVRLHDTIKQLNRNHVHRRIHFRGDGRGWGILWMIVESEEAASPEVP